MDNEQLERRPLDWKFILITSLIAFVYSIFAGILMKNLDRNIGGFEPEGLTDAIVLAVLVAPVVETAVIQVVPFMVVGLFREMLNDKFKHAYIIFSSLIFAFSHGYSNEYVTIMYLPGIALAYTYFRAREQNRPAFATTALVHLLHNLAAVLWNHFMK